MRIDLAARLWCCASWVMSGSMWRHGHVWRSPGIKDDVIVCDRVERIGLNLGGGTSWQMTEIELERWTMRTLQSQPSAAAVSYNHPGIGRLPGGMYRDFPGN